MQTGISGGAALLRDESLEKAAWLQSGDGGRGWGVLGIFKESDDVSFTK